jgi:hypothetical protein
MRYRIGPRGFPVADQLIPPGTEINTDDIAGSRLAALVPPVDATPLDDACYQLMRRHYEGVGLGHLLGPPPPPSTPTSTKRDLAGRTKSSALYRQPRFQLWGYFRGSIY